MFLWSTVSDTGEQYENDCIFESARSQLIETENIAFQLLHRFSVIDHESSRSVDGPSLHLNSPSEIIGRTLRPTPALLTCERRE